MRLLICALVITILTLTSGYSFQPVISTRERPRAIAIVPANLLEELAERRRNQPNITASQLARYGNELLKKRGFDYDFDVCDAVPQRSRTAASTWDVRNDLSLTDGGTLKVKYEVQNPSESLCGECDAQVPSLQVTKQEILLVAGGKRHRVRRPATFLLDEAELVDASMKRVLRTWQLPYQTVPIGISADGTRLYLEFYTQFPLEDLALEISGRGVLAIRARADVGLRDEGEWLERLPKYAADTKLTFMRFKAGNKTYIVRSMSPCT